MDTLNTTTTTTTSPCALCLDDSQPLVFCKDQSQKSNLCSHQFCKSCLEMWIENRLGDNQRTIPCPDDSCKAFLDVSDVARVSTPLCEQFNSLLVKYTNEKKQQQQQQAASNKSNNNNATALSDDDTGKWINSHCKHCPNCDVLITRESGCRMVFCPCGTEFCFSCGNRQCVCPPVPNNMLLFSPFMMQPNGPTTIPSSAHHNHHHHNNNAPIQSFPAAPMYMLPPQFAPLPYYFPSIMPIEQTTTVFATSHPSGLTPTIYTVDYSYSSYPSYPSYTSYTSYPSYQSNPGFSSFNLQSYAVSNMAAMNSSHLLASHPMKTTPTATATNDVSERPSKRQRS